MKRAMSLGRQRDALIVVLLTVLGGLWRLASYRFNVWPHGDVVIDAAISESVAWYGRLLVPFVDVRYYPTERFGFGYPLDQHPPLWPLLGAPLVWLTGDGYVALKLVSLLIGVALIPLSYLGLRGRIGNGPALFASALTAGSFALVDFSGNGSLWVLLAAFYLAWLWVIPRPAVTGLMHGDPTTDTTGRARFIAPLDAGRWALLGVVMGLAYLTNYPAVVLPVALVFLHLVRHRQRAFRLNVLAGPAVSAVVMLLMVSPWLIYNANLFGGPFWSQPFQRTLAGGSRDVEYFLANGEAVKRNLPTTGDRAAALRSRAIDLYGNVGFLAKQSLVLTPVLGGLFLVGLLMLAGGRGVGAMNRAPASDDPAGARFIAPDQHIAPASHVAPDQHDASATHVAPDHHDAPNHHDAPASSDVMPIAVLALVHLALIVWWPTTKFRYLIPLLPLIFAIGGWALWQFQPAGLRFRLATVTLALCLFTNAWTMLSIPSRTYYYDGGLVGDNFGQQGERQFMDEARSFKAAADAIVARGRGVVLGDHIMAPFTRMPLVVNSTGYSEEVVAHLVRKYDVRYVVIDIPHANLYEFLEPATIWANDRHVVLEIPRR